MRFSVRRSLISSPSFDLPLDELGTCTILYYPSLLVPRPSILTLKREISECYDESRVGFVSLFVAGHEKKKRNDRSGVRTHALSD